MTYLLLYLVPYSVNACIILVVNPFLCPPPSSNLRTRSDLIVNTVDEVENMLGSVMLVVVEDGQHVSHLKVSLLYCTCEECHTTRLTSAYATHPLDEEGFSVARTYQPIDSLEVCDACVTISPNHRLVVVLEVEAIGDAMTQHLPLCRLVEKVQTMKLGHLGRQSWRRSSREDDPKRLWK
jgi:hypothetical protein